MINPDEHVAEAYQPRGLYFEDFEIGKRYTTPRRTVTSSDIALFCGVTGDFNAPHSDFEFCRTQPYGEPIAHGPLVYGIAAGLQCQSGMNDGTIVGFLGVDHWRILKPVKHGDTIHMVMTPSAKRVTSKGDRGIVTFEREIRNQHKEVVQTLTSSSMYLCRDRQVGEPAKKEGQNHEA